eukprot:CAMPEP_0198323642 /NCGR_PEP_ID=MMETSP1450-20131203/11834_1 /TAXON_ID=753684 ORGANISM="Madagascaria erythrocladiodes, Strain CCMP3234" /NCGR_SAMPLE_ID=MMETSP1450 /ASSEMBLY_ACC=CAM_ASM_001115 /LENGTH=266 /DNA_ID=CAMNT_0044027369 /DNA_START=77 /DNA_END=874 /DNA_ORIENTATION=-
MSAVRLRLYDLSNGMCAQLSEQFLGQRFDGIWHTGVHVFGQEWWFGGASGTSGGIVHDNNGRTPYGGALAKELTLGTTAKTRQEFEAFVAEVAPRFTIATYDLIHHNCNTFTNECAMFLLDGTGIPRDIIELPQRLLATPLGASLRPLIENYQRQMQQQFGGTAVSASPTAAAAKHETHVETAPEYVLFRKGDAVTIGKKLHELIAAAGVRLGKDEELAVAAVPATLNTTAEPFSAMAVRALADVVCALPQSSSFAALDLLRLVIV